MRLRPCAESRRRQDGGTLLGLLLGLCVGVLISFGVVWYLNRTPLPFLEKQPRPEQGTSNATPGNGPVALPGKPGDKPIERPGERKYDFYDILEGKSPKATQEAAPSSAPREAASAGEYYLQAGAFQNRAEADQLKARLAMLGLEASVADVTVAGKGTLHRVRVGPFASAEEMNRARGQLSQNGVPAAVVRGKDQ